MVETGFAVPLVGHEGSGYQGAANPNPKIIQAPQHRIALAPTREGEGHILVAYPHHSPLPSLGGRGCSIEANEIVVSGEIIFGLGR